MGEPRPALVDGFRRPITYLRLSLTDRCDLRCAYCMPERARFAPRDTLLTIDELERVAAGFVRRGVTKIRLTGGEPLVRRGALDLVARLGARLGYGLHELTLTTNGLALPATAEALFAAGVRRVNVSLDTLDPARFATIARRDRLAGVLEGVAAAKAAGLAVKINAVAMKDVNEDELPALVEWAHGEGHGITLIELMPFGPERERFLSLAAVRERLEARWTLTPLGKRTGGPARYVRVEETGGALGFVTPLSANFCEGCNRVRVAADGSLYPCLGDAGRVDLRAALRGGSPGAFDAALDAALRLKPERHRFEARGGVVAGGPGRAMAATGG